MKKVTLREAKINLSKLIDVALQGEEVVIYKAGRPAAKLVAFHSKKRIRKPGIWKGKVIIQKDFDELPTQLMKSFK